ncbi:Trehalose-phosphatase [Wickerhamiella sorbophila]|uniref:Trehalose-phosphatase n=1 Tax=Wickerhamiella sorbophila TaxID=45607 RepID=A0A2T0FI70_9ASCO|nr:Trehalose-phosphatase [Wickerhamiella sorbophila]PRT54675.1 Trehalose-phosphatase [Wickerhamiella sorbophila]
MDSNYVHRTPYLGDLVDPQFSAKWRPELLNRTHTSAPYTHDLMGKSPQSARASGATVSGRVLSVTSGFSHVLNRDHNSKRLFARQRKGLSSLFSAVENIGKSRWESIWVAWPGEIEEEGVNIKLTEDEKASVTQLLSKNSSSTIVPVWLDPPTQWRYYPEYVLWPTFHYVQNVGDTIVDQESHKWDTYRKFNEAYASAILAIYRPGDIIWIHDYYLLLLPEILRRKLNDAHILLFVHTPFSSSEYLRCIPQRNDLLIGMLGATIVGFQSKTYVRHFESACTRLLGVEKIDGHLQIHGRVVGCECLPTGIDTEFVIKETASAETQSIINGFKKIYEGKKIIIGRDKIDSAQSTIQKLQAFELFLQNYPYWRNKVVLIQITTHGFESSTRMEKKVSKLISKINGTYGNLQFAPVLHFTDHLPQRKYFALLACADLGVFTGIRDAASHAAFEYVVCQKDTQNPIMLSEFTGVAEVFEDAIIVNPYDGLVMADAINYALTKAEKCELYSLASELKTQNWLESGMGRLLRHEFKHEVTTSTPELDKEKLRKAYHAAEKRLFLFDYDGTLTPIVKDPAAAVPSKRLKSILSKLGSDPKNEIWVISGRDQHFLDRWLGEFNMSMSAEHGCFVKHAGETKWTDLVAQMDNSWQPIVFDILQNYTDRTQGSSIEKKKAALTWHYRRSDPVFGAFQASNLRGYLQTAVATCYPVDIMAGKANVEIRPRMFNKGEIVRSIFRDESSSPSFVFCTGDDTTDEDMFRAVNDENKPESFFTVVVGPSSKLTLARWHIQNPDLVHDCLAALIN